MSALISFFLVAFVAGGITATPGTALAAGGKSAKAKKADDQDKKDKKDKKVDPREMQARANFAAGRYVEALETFAKLYAETLHPTYLRNIGRCYMNMDQPDRAGNSFREYLRKAKDLNEAERKEVEGYIAEMDRVQKQKDDAAAAAAAPTRDLTPLPQQPAPQPFLPPPPPPSPPAPAPTPLYAKGWFWGVVGGVAVVGVLGVLWATGTFKSGSKCVTGYTCAP